VLRRLASRRKNASTSPCNVTETDSTGSERPECLYRWRLGAGFGKRWEWTKVKDIIRETLFSRIYRACKEWKNCTGRGQFYDRMDLVRQMVIVTIERRWSVGCGPRGVPYGKCADDFWIEQEIFCELLPGFPGEGY